MKLRLTIAAGIIAVVAYMLWASHFAAPTGMPPGWGMETDGKEYRFVRPSGNSGLFTYYTKLGCRRDAWRQYHLAAKEATRNWVPVLRPDITNSSILFSNRYRVATNLFRYPN